MSHFKQVGFWKFIFCTFVEFFVFYIILAIEVIVHNLIYILLRMKNVTELNVGSSSVANGAKSKTRNIFLSFLELRQKNFIVSLYTYLPMFFNRHINGWVGFVCWNTIMSMPLPCCYLRHILNLLDWKNVWITSLENYYDVYHQQKLVAYCT